MTYSATHLIAQAEALAYPLVASNELRAARTRLIVNDAVSSLTYRLRAHGLTEAAPEHIQRAWPDARVPILARIRELARALLHSDYLAMRLCTDPERPGLEILRWRYISLALPVGVLVAAATPFGARPSLRVDLLHPSFAPAGPVAHLHLHVGAASSFESLWANLMARRLPGPKEFKAATKRPEGIDGEEWLALLTRAALARPVLDAMSRQVRSSLDDALSAHCHANAHGPALTEALNELVTGRVGDYCSLREAQLRKLAASSHFRTPRTLDAIWENDPIADGAPWPEGRMIALLFDRLADEPDSPGSLLFLQYLRVKSLLHRVLTHDPAERGLRTFVHTFRQIGPYRRGHESILPEFALNEPALDLRAVEVRTAPPRSGREAKEWVDNLNRLRDRRASDTEVAWVFHFIRDPKPPVRRRNSSPVGDSYHALYRSLRQNAGVLSRAIRSRPELLKTIRGIDLAGNERSGPLWLALPHVMHLRRLSRDVASARSLAPLRLTLHVGEDFRHLASGLRAIHEPFGWCLMTRGDRLGHALALGVDPDKWCRSHPQVLMPRWERMLDLAWMIAALTHRLPDLRFAGDGHGLQLARMREELRRHLGYAGVAPDSPDSFVDFFVDVLGNEESLPRLLDRQFIPATSTPLHLLELRLRGPIGIQTKLDEIVEVPTAKECLLLVDLSRKIAEVVGAWQVTIEVNPSSNLLIAGLDHPLDQPIFRLHPLDGKDGAALPVTINADDPLTFATTLADEYAYTWAALTVAGGVAPGYARQWLDETARASWRARFTLPTPPKTP